MTIAVNNLANYPNVIEDALIARVVELKAANVISASATLARTDCLFPTYARGA